MIIYRFRKRIYLQSFFHDMNHFLQIKMKGWTTYCGDTVKYCNWEASMGTWGQLLHSLYVNRGPDCTTKYYAFDIKGIIINLG